MLSVFASTLIVVWLSVTGGPVTGTFDLKAGSNNLFDGPVYDTREECDFYADEIRTNLQAGILPPTPPAVPDGVLVAPMIVACVDNYVAP